MHIPSRLYKIAYRAARFVFSGGMAFVVDAAVLEGLTRIAHFPPLLARIFSIAIAMVAAWLMHRKITFQTQKRPTFQEFRDYVAVALAAALLNYATFGVLVTLFKMTNFPALVVASAVAMLFSYLGMHFRVFRA